MNGSEVTIWIGHYFDAKKNETSKLASRLPSVSGCGSGLFSERWAAQPLLVNLQLSN